MSSLVDDVSWVFDIEDLPSRQTSRQVAVAVQTFGLFGLVLAAFFVSWFVGLAAAALLVCSRFGLKLYGCGTRVSHRVRVTHLGVCRLDEGQRPLRLLRLWRHPWCTVLELDELEPLKPNSRPYRYVVWRHHYTNQSYRRLILVLRWISGQEAVHA